MALDFKIKDECIAPLLLLIGHDTDHDFFQNLDPFTKKMNVLSSQPRMGGGGKGRRKSSQNKDKKKSRARKSSHPYSLRSLASASPKPIKKQSRRASKVSTARDLLNRYTYT